MEILSQDTVIVENCSGLVKHYLSALRVGENNAFLWLTENVSAVSKMKYPLSIKDCRECLSEQQAIGLVEEIAKDLNGRMS